jgi:putative flippase GtrA
MTLAAPKIAKSAWRKLPKPLRRWLRGKTGSQLMRFVPVSVAAVAASQIVLALLVGVAHRTAGFSAVIASMAGAGVSYILSRWAWRRKGRPHVLKEMLPFWAVSVGAWMVLGLTSHFASVQAKHHGLSHWQQVAVVNAAYLMANCVTFLTRFAIFHYVLFADRGSGPRLSSAEPVESADSVAFALAADSAAGEPARPVRPVRTAAEPRAR